MTINVTNQSPAPSGPIPDGGALSFDVTFDPPESQNTILISLRFPGAGGELAWDGSGFPVPYAGSSSREDIPDGWRFTFHRSGNWPAYPTISIQPVATDLAVVEADIEALDERIDVLEATETAVEDRLDALEVFHPDADTTRTRVIDAPTIYDLQIGGAEDAALGAQSRHNVVLMGGRQRTTTGLSGALGANHPSLGSWLDVQAYGTRGTPDTIGYVRMGYPMSARHQSSGPLVIETLGANGAIFVDLSNAAASGDLRDVSGIVKLRWNNLGVSINGACETGQASALRLGQTSAPSVSPTSAIFCWWNGTTLNTRDPSGAACDIVLDVVTCSSLTIPTTTSFSIGADSRLGDIVLNTGDPGSGVDSGMLVHRADGAVKKKSYFHGSLAAYLDWHTGTTYVMASSISHLTDDNANKKFSYASTGIAFFGASLSAKATITGSRTTGAALASLLTELATKGLITDGSSA